MLRADAVHAQQQQIKAVVVEGAQQGAVGGHADAAAAAGAAGAKPPFLASYDAVTDLGSSLEPGDGGGGQGGGRRFSQRGGGIKQDVKSFVLQKIEEEKSQKGISTQTLYTQVHAEMKAIAEKAEAAAKAGKGKGKKGKKKGKGKAAKVAKVVAAAWKHPRPTKSNKRIIKRELDLLLKSGVIVAKDSKGGVVKKPKGLGGKFWKIATKAQKLSPDMRHFVNKLRQKIAEVVINWCDMEEKAKGIGV